MVRRPRGSRHARRPPVRRSRLGGFEALVERALDSIPEPFARALDEVAIVIEDEPSPLQLADSGLGPDDGLYGLYEGVPRTEWGADMAFVPNKICLFRIPLEEDFPDHEELEREVWITVIHELAHHLGIEEDRLHELGID
jgi:predicted Zn-dependent protease with MMP-like domain